MTWIRLSTKVSKIYFGRLIVCGAQNICKITTPKSFENDANPERIMADIYGSQQDIIFKEGLADAVDSNDLSARIENLRPTWENLAPGFTDWFRKNRVEKFNECLVIEARDAHGITKRYTTNALENQHRIERKELKEDQIPKHMADVSEKLGECVQSYYTEARRAIRGIGKYRLAPDYQYLAVEPGTWCSWNDEKRDVYFEKFMRARPLAYAFEIPENAGKK
uniref:Uncharacterized protein n=1 Tax=Clytia hemisphaerica TaxID=252671 RepID=A0A7M5X2F9_9CNID